MTKEEIFRIIWQEYYDLCEKSYKEIDEVKEGKRSRYDTPDYIRWGEIRKILMAIGENVGE